MNYDELNSWRCHWHLLLAEHAEPRPRLRRRSRRRRVDLPTHNIKDTTRRIGETRLDELRFFLVPRGCIAAATVLGRRFSCSDLLARPVPGVDSYREVYALGCSGAKSDAVCRIDPRSVMTSAPKLV